MEIRNWAGGVLFIIGAWMIVSAWQRRSRAMAAYRLAKAEGRQLNVGTNPKFAMTGAIARPLVFLMLMAAALEVAGSYVAMGGSKLFSYVDLAGFLFALLAYAIWFSISTRYRQFTPPAKPV